MRCDMSLANRHHANNKRADRCPTDCGLAEREGSTALVHGKRSWPVRQLLPFAPTCILADVQDQRTLRLQQPTVSASSSSFSWPARSARMSMKYSAVAICAFCSSFDSQSFSYWALHGEQGWHASARSAAALVQQANKVAESEQHAYSLFTTNVHSGRMHTGCRQCTA
jgi:hypothetical protein